MTDILCPLCGKPTPEDQDTCRHCQAPLKGQIPTTPFDGDKLPDWLLDLQASEPTIPEEPSSSKDAAPLETDLPDWLRQAIPPAEAIPSPEQPAGAAAEKNPEWLDRLLSASQKPELPAEVVPDWLAGLGEAEKPGFPAQEQAFPPDELAGAPQKPIFLQDEQAAPKEEEIGPTNEQSAPPIEEGELPDWLARLQAEAAEKPTGSVPAFIFNEEPPAEEKPAAEDRPLSTLPDWVSQITAEQPEEPAAEPEPGLAPAELPGWLEAMRPMETSSPTAPLEDLSTAETVASGPLLGLRGVLSAEPDAIRARKPAAYALKLRVTEDQRARLGLLEELLAGEQKPKPIPPLPAITPQYLFRLAIALALLLPILWVMVNQSNIAPLPVGEDQPTVMQFDTAIRRLNEGDPVLVAVDYEAGFTGEMDRAAKVLLSRLVEQGAYLVLASTNTAGPALSQRLLTSLDATLGSPYEGVANLGYLPGGALGLAGLVQSPRQLLPYTLDDSDPWAFPPLDAVNTLADFSMVIVIANDADTARAWIEQTSKDLQAGNVPLLLVVSAQAEPLVRPYTQGTSPQVQALLAGLSDSAAYENMTTRYSVGRHDIWQAYSLTLPIAALVIIIGSLAGAVITAIKEGQEEAKNKPKSRRKTERKQERP
jgi:hypothetical protein